MLMCCKLSKIVFNENYPSNLSGFLRERMLGGTFIRFKNFSVRNAYYFL